MTQISPISAAQHYATSTQFWEQHAKLLQHKLDEANARIVELERRLEPPPDPTPDPTPDQNPA